MHSAQPAIEAMVAVGAIAMSSELRSPVRATFARSSAHAAGRVRPASGQWSRCSTPRAARVSA